MRRLLPVVPLLVSACTFDLELPPPPGPASISGALAYAIPGKTELAPAAGATVELLNSSLSTTASAEGYFLLEGLTVERGTLLIRFDANGDGSPDRQRSLDLSSLGVRPGRELNLGQVVIGKNASVTGRALRADRAGVPTGHAGSTVFVPEGPYATITADDGSYTLTDLPEGPLSVAVFRPGFEVAGVDVVLRSGEELRAQDLVLPLSTPTDEQGALSGRVLLERGGAGTGAQVTLLSQGQAVASTTAGADGGFAFMNLPVGLYDVSVRRDGYQNSLTRNLYLREGSNRLSDVVLAPGTSTPLDAGALLPLDGGQVQHPDRTEDGGIDPGPPFAVISPSELSVTPDAGTLLVTGERSFGLQPLRYQWSVEEPDAGASVTPASPSPYASSALVVPPPPGQLATVALRVVDPKGRTSPAATARILVSEPPRAVVSPAGPLTLPPKATLSAAGSTDPLGLGLRYDWRVDYGGVSLSAFDLPTVEVTGQSLGPARVTVQVSNAFGLASPPVSVDRIGAVAGADFAVDAGPPQEVAGGSLVFLSGSVLSAQPLENFDVEWLEWGGAGGVTINNRNQPVANVYLPDITGADQLRTFALRASYPKGCDTVPSPTCTFREAETTVRVSDATPPTAHLGTNTEVSVFGPLRFTVSEPLNEASVTASTVRLVDVGGGGDWPLTRSYSSATQEVRLELQKLLVDGASYQLVLEGLEDRSSLRNTLALTQRTFTARGLRGGPVFRSQGTGSTTLSPFPGVGVLAPTGPGQEERIFVTSRRGAPDTQWFYNFLTQSHFGPGPLMDQSSLALPVVAPVGRRVHGVGGKLYALLGRATGTSWTAATDGVLALYEEETNTWRPLTRHAPPGVMGYSAPGQVFAHQGALLAIVARSGLRVLPLQTSGVVTSWAFADALGGAGVEILDTDTTTFADAPSLVAGGFSTGLHRTVAAFEPGTARIRVARAEGSGSWKPLGYGDPELDLGTSFFPLDVRVAETLGTVVVAAMGTVSGAPVVRTLSCKVAACDWTDLALTPGVHDGFDLEVRGPAAVLALASGGVMKVYTADLAAPSPSWVFIPGPATNSGFNEDGTCFAEAPELGRSGQGLWLVFGEKCSAGSWQVVLRRLE